MVLGLFCPTLGCVFGRTTGLYSAIVQTHLQRTQAFKCTDVSSLGSVFEGERGFPAV